MIAVVSEPLVNVLQLMPPVYHEGVVPAEGKVVNNPQKPGVWVYLDADPLAYLKG
ncbi:hypothetical protein [Thermococcus sp.]|uniref:hypothetical protein n=1 Tax=Thermococcus sp. TaxID=35749 RepID=UPI00261AE9E6|nr:hypothetical protein [Thermococcus sp.]